MSDTLERIPILIAKLLKQEANEQELMELEDWKRASAANAAALEEMLHEGYVENGLRELEAAKRRSDQLLIAAGIPLGLGNAPAPVHKVSILHRFRWVAAAAVLVLAIGVGGYYWLQQTHSQQDLTAEVILPGGHKAMLTLADGSEVMLDSTGGLAIRQGHTAIRQQGGQLYYYTEGTPEAAGYNKLTTPIGGQFRVTLPDGTKVWLNAASSLRYPTAFTAGDRVVEVTGEAYFEVMQNATQPFKVKVNNESTTIIEVLGTDFNVNAYTDEPSITTTLLEGAVRVRAGNRQAALTPGQQAQVNKGSNIKIVNNADLSAAVAWKDGIFYFKDADLPTVLRQIGRWYNVEIVYEGAVPAQSFRGKLGRDLSLADVVEALQRSEVKCRVEGRKLIVAP
ncbi:FecR family protein [Chitinophaga agrisoli]|uniref:FecR family protein n=1 Tax=Chitinophaga agrisoli TaxID=2607653 RepID=A0A5B2VPZ9_9BACT|nr:FecR family protein [Chitinophaga agrisoli]KAA2240794.1 FecR family protein [Chitinophaga agrisoli]